MHGGIHLLLHGQGYITYAVTVAALLSSIAMGACTLSVWTSATT